MNHPHVLSLLFLRMGDRDAAATQAEIWQSRCPELLSLYEESLAHHARRLERDVKLWRILDKCMGALSKDRDGEKVEV